MRKCVSPRRRFRGSLAALSILVALGLAGSARLASAQTAFAPYYGKNNIHYDNFEWHIYVTDHFEIYYYPEIERHLARVAGYAESAYQKVSSDLKHDLSVKVPLILFKTHSEFEQQNVAPGAAQEGVAAFAEPFRQRMVLPIDDAPDNLYGLIVHELTHQFQYDIIPMGLIRQNVPLWVNEGGAEWERAQWDPMDLMMVRDAAVADFVPKMSQTMGYGNGGGSARLVPYNLGHALYEFIEARFGVEGVRQFLFALRKSVIGGGSDAYEEALHMKPDEFDQAFERYIKDRFKPFRDKERPADYGRDLAPNAEKTQYTQALSIAPSPSGDLIAVVTVNRKDGEVDIVLVSSRDGSIIKNLTSGFDKSYGFTNITQPTSFNSVPWMSWSPKGDRLVYLVRTEKERTLVIQNVLTDKIEQRIPMKSVDDPESPAFSPDGNMVAVSAMRGGIRDIYLVDLQTQNVTNVTEDDFFDYGPTYSPDGKFLIYKTRVSGNQKLFRLDLDTKKKTQVTFGTNDETSAQFIDDHTLVFSSTATDPTVPLDPEVAKNGNIYNIWTLDLNNGELKQYTDAVSGVLSPIVLSDTAGPKIAFISYYKGDYGIHTLDRKEPLHTASSSDFGAPGPIIDFQAPLTHTLLTSNARKKGAFEKMFLEGRPPVNVGVTNSGDVFGGTQISFGDVLGDKQFSMFASSIAQYRTLSFSYANIGRRFQYALQGYSQTQFFFAQLQGVFYDPSLAPFINRDLATAVRTTQGGTAFGIYPLSRYRRLELTGGLVRIVEQYNSPDVQAAAQNYQQQQFGQQVFRNGFMVPVGAAFVQETTVFREYGPLSGSTLRLAYNAAPKLGNSLSQQTLDGDARYYQRLASSGVLALRLRGFKSVGSTPNFLYFGGNSEMRGYDYLQFVGQNVAFANAEIRFPIIEAALTPIGVIGGIRGTFFANIGGGWFNNSNFKFWTSDTESIPVISGYQTQPDGQLAVDAGGLPIPIYGTPATVSGFRLRDSRASYGFGLQTFALGFPLHFDWAWRTTFNKEWEDVTFASTGGSSSFRKPRFAMWIGYDF